MSRRTTVTSGFAGLMVVLTLVGVGMGYATALAISEPATTRVGTGRLPTSSVPDLQTTTSTTSTVSGRLQGPRCAELHEIVSSSNPVFFAGVSADIDMDMLATLRALFPTTTTYLDLGHTQGAATPAKRMNGVLIVPYAMKDKLGNLVLTNGGPDPMNAVVFYSSDQQAMEALTTTIYPAVLLLIDPTDGPESLRGNERLVANIIRDGSKSAGCK